MVSSNFLSKIDFNVLNTAFQRKLDCDLASKDNCATKYCQVDFSKKLWISCHDRPEKITNEICICDHVFEKKVLSNSLRVFEGNHRNQTSSTSERTNFNSLFWVNPKLKSLEDLLTLQKHQHLMAKPLQEVLNQIDPLGRLLWIVELLIEYHHGLECREFLSTAIRLCLEGYKVSNYGLYNADGMSKDASHCFMKMVQKNHCEEELLGEVLKVFFEDRVSFLCFVRETCDLKTILTTLPKTNWGVKGLLNRNRPGELQIFDLMFDHENFVTLVEFGAFSDYSKKDWDIMKKTIYLWDWQEMMRFRHFFTTQTTCLIYNDIRYLRFHQVGRLFENCSANESSRRESEYLLNLLWAAVADPFLSRADLEFCLNRCHPNPVIEKRLKDCFDWFQNIILKGRSCEKTPRSLQQLCRFNIRKTLSLNFQLPDGVQSLRFPNLLKNYLLLKDCGVSPFKERTPEEIFKWLHSMDYLPKELERMWKWYR